MTITPPTLTAAGFDAEDPIRVRVREPGDFVALAPYLLHFHPENSIVLILLAGGRLALTARMDLPPPQAIPDVIEQIEYLLRRTGADEYVVLGYGGGPADRATVAELAGELGPEMLEAVWVEPDRWWSLTCTGSCCPPEGRPYDPGAHPIAATAVFAGLDAGGDRADLAALAAGPLEPDQVRLRRRCQVIQRRLGGARRSRQRRLDRLVGVLAGRTDPPGVDEALLAALLCADVAVRDIAFTRLDRATAKAHLRLWSAVVRRVPEELASAPLCLLGVAGWLSGNGALLNCCIERLIELDPGYPMLRILRGISDGAFPPSAWEGLLVELRGDPDLRLQ